MLSYTKKSALVAALVLGASACGTTEPEVTADFDADAALQDYAALDQALASDEFKAFKALGDRTPFTGGPNPVGIVASLEALEDDPRAYALELTRRIHRANLGGPEQAPIISDTHRGVTFVYDPAIDDYAPDTTRTGAPATGVRFIIYEVEEDGTPIVAQEIGHADLIDEGDNSVEDIVLRLVVVQNSDTVLDYRTSLDSTPTGGALTVQGFLRGDGVQLDFDIEATGTDGPQPTLDIAFELGVAARNFSIVGSVSGAEGDNEDGRIDVTIRHGTDAIRVDIQNTAGEMDGRFFVNGAVFVTVSGPEDSPTFLGATGEPLTAQEALVLHRIVDVFEDVFDFLEDLVDPVDDLVLAGIIL